MNHLFEMMSPLRTDIDSRFQINVDDLRCPSDRQSRLPLNHCLNGVSMPRVEGRPVDRAKFICEQHGEVDLAEDGVDIAPRLDRTTHKGNINESQDLDIA